MSWRDWLREADDTDEEDGMIRTVVQAGDAVQARRTVEFEEKAVCHLEFVETAPGTPEQPQEQGAPTLWVYLHGRTEPLSVTEPAVIAKLWKVKKPGKT